MNQQQPSPEKNKGLALTISDIESLRTKQEELLLEGLDADMMHDDDLMSAQEQAVYAKYDELADDYLKLQGIDSTDTRYAANKQLISEFSLDKIADNEWYADSEDADGKVTPSGRELLRARLAGEKPTAPSQVDQYKPTDESLLDNESETAAINMRFAELVAERSKRSFERASKTNEINDLRDELSDMIGAVATEMMLVLEEKGMTESQIANEIDKFVGEQMELTVSEIELNRAADYEKRSPVIRRALDKWVSWGEPRHKFLTRERFKGNLKKAAVFAVPGAVIGAVAAPLVGAIGGGIVAGGLAAAGARSIGRHLMGARIDAAANAKSIATEQADKNREHIASHADAAHTELLGLFDQQSEVYRKINRRRLIGGTAIAVAAGALGGTLSQVIANEGNIAFGKLGGLVSDRFGDNSGGQSQVGSSSLQDRLGVRPNPNIGSSAAQEPGPSTLSAHSPAPKVEAGSGLPAVDHQKLVGDYINSHAAGVKVTAGEGWDQTFQEFGIAPGHDAQLLKEIGPKLKDMDIAYEDKSIGGWGISRSGALPKEVSQLIIDKANEHGWIKLGNAPLETGGQVKEIIDTAQISKGGGIISEAHDYGINNLSNEDVSTIGQALVNEGTGYKSSTLAEHFGNQYGIKYDASLADATPAGEFRPGARAIFEDFADNRSLNHSAGYDAAGAAAESSAAPARALENLNADAVMGVEPQVSATDLMSWVKSGDLAKLNLLDNAHASDLAAQLKDLTYSNGQPVVRYGAMSGSWHFNDVPFGLTVPSEVQSRISDYASKHTYDLAA